MKSKRPHLSPQKPVKRRCVGTPRLSQAPTPAAAGGGASPVGTDRGSVSDKVSSNDQESRTSLPSTSESRQLDGTSITHLLSSHDRESSPGNDTSQDPAVADERSDDDHCETSFRASSVDSNIASKSSSVAWPVKSQGLIEDICDLSSLKQLMTSGNLSDDHKAMWVSLVQTIAYEPDQKSVLVFLQNILSGDMTLPDIDCEQPFASGQPVFGQQKDWVVILALKKYGGAKKLWSAAHLVDLTLWLGGPQAAIQTARALKVFGVWNPEGNTIAHPSGLSIPSIRDCLDQSAILRRIWPANNSNEILLIGLANHSNTSTAHSFERFEDAYSSLLVKCVGERSSLLTGLAKGDATSANAGSRIISRAYFDRILSPILRKYFDPDVDLELAYAAIVNSQGISVERCVEQVRSFVGEPPRRAPPVTNGTQHPDQRRTSYFMAPAQQDDYDGDDDEELFRNGTMDVKAEPRVETQFAFDYDHEEEGLFDENASVGDHEVAEKAIPPVPAQKMRIKEPLWTYDQAQSCLDVLKQIFFEEPFITLHRHGGIYKEAAKRLKSEHNIDHSPESIKHMWQKKWSRIPGVVQRVRPSASYTANRSAPVVKVEQLDDAIETNTTRQDGARTAIGLQDSVTRAVVTRGSPPLRSVGPLKQARSNSRLDALMTSTRVTRFEAKEKRITNDLYQRSRNIHSDTIAQYLQTGRSPFNRNWQAVLEHRSLNNMMTSGLENNPPYSAEELPDDTLRPDQQLNLIIRAAQANIDNNHSQNIEDDIERLERFARSLIVQGTAQSTTPAENSS